jgi:glycosyltransferase involved in cell wall biosynthesis
MAILKPQLQWKNLVNKFLILMCYYNRPNLVRFALHSVKRQSYKNWEICFVDDGSDISAKDSIDEILGDEKDKIFYFNTNLSTEEKKINGGSNFGSYWNLRCQLSNADYALILCDDDALMKEYLSNLDQYFQKTNKKWCYSHFAPYNPYEQTEFLQEKIKCNNEMFKNFSVDLNPESVLEACQVVFSLDAFKNNGIEFAYPKTANLDSDLFEKLFPLYGLCSFCSFYGQFKSVSHNRLEIRQNSENLFYVNDIDIEFRPEF